MRFCIVWILFKVSRTDIEIRTSNIDDYMQLAGARVHHILFRAKISKLTRYAQPLPALSYSIMATYSLTVQML